MNIRVGYLLQAGVLSGRGQPATQDIEFDMTSARFVHGSIADNLTIIQC